MARVNPLLPEIAAAGFDGYWFGIDQAELATDILFNSRADLERIHPHLVHAAIIGFGATDVMRFLGRKPHHAFTGEVVIDSKKRPEGCRIKFRIRRNSIKLYDHLNVLRIETTLNNPAEFKILSSSESANGQVVCRWCPMRKGVSNFSLHPDHAIFGSQDEGGSLCLIGRESMLASGCPGGFHRAIGRTLPCPRFIAARVSRSA